MAGEYGRYHTLTRNDWGFIAPGQLRGVTFNAATQHLWVYELGIWAGKYTTLSSTNVTTRLAAYTTDASMHPTSRLGYSDSFTVSTVMNDQSGGASHTASVATVDTTAPAGVTFSAIPLASGSRYHLATLGTSGYLAHAMAQAAAISADNEYFYNRSGLSQPPPDPFGSYSRSVEGHITIWANAEVNVAPDTPTSLSPAGSINETAPTFSAAFADDNEDRGDYLNQYRIQVRRKSDGTSFWNATFSSSESERTADAISRAYAGTTLVRGTAYEWRCQMSDHFGAWSSWTAWTEFTPANLGFVTLDSDPTGTIEDDTPDFKGRWTHQSSEDMTHAQVRLWNSAGTTVLQTGSEYDITDVSSSASPGTLFTVAWANTGFSTLAWGTGYQYQIRGKDASGNWSDWSDKRSFATNAAPSVPSGLSPANSQILTAYPELRCTASDADDTVATGLEVWARIKDSGGSVLFTRQMTYDSGAGVWEYQTDGTDLASYATYRWDAYSYDGHLYSGAVTSSASATTSDEAVFQYAQGPTVTVTSPANNATITTANLPITWTTTDQQKYRIYLYEDGTTTTVYDSGEQTSTTSSHTIPTGYLRNDTSYDLVVWVEDSTPLTGQSSTVNITVDYVEPAAPANFAAETLAVTTDLWDSAIRLTWDQTEIGTDSWQEYTIARTAARGPDTDRIILARITSPTQTAYIDYTPASGIEYTYTITQTQITGLDELRSAEATASATVDLGGVVLVSVSSPDELRTALRYTSERDYPTVKDEAVYQPLSGATPTTVRTGTNYVEPTFDAQLFADDGATAATRRAELEAIDADTSGTYCYRDNHGRKHFVLVAAHITDRVPDWYVARIELREQRYTEGVD